MTQTEITNSIESRKIILIVLLLSVLVLASYWGVQGNGFVNYDDPAYVVENRHVKAGLSGEEIVWAFTASYVSNWHPLTWLSLMLDHDLYGMNAGGYHWTSVLIHLLGVLMLFFVLRRMTGDLWCSALVAGLFGVHPLHVESVAWISERKDVLSGLFWMLGLWGYARYVERPGWGRYGTMALFFILGLLSKPMVVTFPFVLLLLDWWPLGRLGRPSGRSLISLAYEKIPLFVLSAVSSVITFVVQREAESVASLVNLPIVDRLGNAAVSYLRYLVKMALPYDLAVFYPHPGTWPIREVLLSAILLILITGFVLMRRHRQPFWAVGWLWYLGTLLPVIGLVQVGAQSMADRYTYLPLIGIFIMIAWGGKDLITGMSHNRMLAVALSGSILSLLAAMTFIQVGFWRDSVSLFNHALRVTDGNYQAHYNLGKAAASEGMFAEAIGHYRDAIRIIPSYGDAYRNLGMAQMELGEYAEALQSYDFAQRFRPGDGNVHFSRGELFARRGMWSEAISEYRAALEKKPYDPRLRNNLGVALARQGRIPEAILEFRAAIRIDRTYAGAHCNLAMLISRQGENEEAVEHYRLAIRYQPDYANAHYQLSLLLNRKGLAVEAADHLREAKRINPEIQQIMEGQNGVVWVLRTRDRS
jgi:tetratricopeptide (TPR) repeat protein